MSITLLWGETMAHAFRTFVALLNEVEKGEKHGKKIDYYTYEHIRRGFDMFINKLEEHRKVFVKEYCRWPANEKPAVKSSDCWNVIPIDHKLEKTISAIFGETTDFDCIYCLHMLEEPSGPNCIKCFKANNGRRPGFEALA